MSNSDLGVTRVYLIVTEEELSNTDSGRRPPVQLPEKTIYQTLALTFMLAMWCIDQYVVQKLE